MKLSLLTVDHLARTSMKNEARLESLCFKRAVYAWLSCVEDLFTCRRLFGWSSVFESEAELADRPARAEPELRGCPFTCTDRFGRHSTANLELARTQGI
ncbi:hypothetical protein T03_17503 [Trichinella britovi]|uniref:Uncharacterized protein n=1 Tax=Trichinella britovi TaxID=45882 RepID=A0A0V1C5R6_TRIBR|nr:hypothetical protein T03_17503 [Trichinella britovi]